MGMILSLATVSASTIEALRMQPLHVWQVVAPDYPEILEEMTKRGPTLFERLLGRKTESPQQEVKPLVLDPEEGKEMDVDKSWHAIHFLLNGTGEETHFPEGFLLSGGEWVGDVDLGYGPGRMFAPAEVKKVATLLEQHPVDRLCERFDGRRMDKEDVYPRIWDRLAADEDNTAYVATYYASLRDFVDSASEEGLGILIWMS